jgi:hypothetical protein
VPTAIAGKLSGQGATVHLDPTATLLQAFHASILLRRPRHADDASAEDQCVTCAHNRHDLTCVIFSRGIPALFSAGRVACPDRIEGPTP